MPAKKPAIPKRSAPWPRYYIYGEDLYRQSAPKKRTRVYVGSGVWRECHCSLSERIPHVTRYRARQFRLAWDREYWEWIRAGRPGDDRVCPSGQAVRYHFHFDPPTALREWLRPPPEFKTTDELWQWLEKEIDRQNRRPQKQKRR